MDNNKPNKIMPPPDANSEEVADLNWQKKPIIQIQKESERNMNELQQQIIGEIKKQLSADVKDYQLLSLLCTLLQIILSHTCESK